MFYFIKKKIYIINTIDTELFNKILDFKKYIIKHYYKKIKGVYELDKVY